MSISKAEAERWLAGWRALEQHQRQEQRSASFEMRLDQLESMVASRDLFAHARTVRDEGVAARWARIRHAAGIP